MALTQKEFCQILAKLDSQQSSSVSAANRARYGLARLAGSLQLAQRQLEDELQSAVPKGISVPVDTNLYTQLLAICPGLLPPLPKDVARAAIIISALQALLQSDSPGQLLNTMVGNPTARLERVQSLLGGVFTELKSVANSARSGAGIKLPGTGDIAGIVSNRITKEAKALASKALLEALEKAGINSAAVQRCTDRLCAVGVSYHPPG